MFIWDQRGPDREKLRRTTDWLPEVHFAVVVGSLQLLRRLASTLATTPTFTLHLRCPQPQEC